MFSEILALCDFSHLQTRMREMSFLTIKPYVFMLLSYPSRRKCLGWLVNYESAVFYRSKNRQFTRCQPQLQESNARNVYAPTKECNEKVRTWDIYD